MKHTWLSILVLVLYSGTASFAQNNHTSEAIYSGVPWFDNNCNAVSAHGANIIEDHGRYYLFGERHTDTSNAFVGFTCYSSTDLYTWKFESIALPTQDSGKLGPNRVGERPKVMKCPSTGEYVLYMHVDTLNYKDQFVGYATAKNITGPYQFQGPLLFNGRPIKKWDMGTFQDTDGSGYVLLHGGDIYQLSQDYKSITAQITASFDREFEAPALFRKDSIYYFLGSHLSSWEKNDNYYFTATSLKGPWMPGGVVAPEGTLTWYSQASFVLPIYGTHDTTFLYMGDRWSFPKQRSAATYVWQPLTVSAFKLFIPTYLQGWKINTNTGAVLPETTWAQTINNSDTKHIQFIGPWQADTLPVKSADEKNARFEARFRGTQVGLYGLSRPDGGYALVTIANSKGKLILHSTIDFYCKYPVTELKFVSPVLAKDDYLLTVTVLQERGNWSDKRRTDYGSTGYVVSLDKIVFNE